MNYSDPPTTLEVKAYYNIVGGVNEVQITVSDNSYYKILNYPMDSNFYLFTANKSLIGRVGVNFMSSSANVKRGNITVDYLIIDYFLPTQLHTL